MAAKTAVTKTVATKPVAKAAVKMTAKKVAATTKAPKGSPLGVQLATIVVLLILGIGYFRLMSHSGRRTPATKPAEEPAVSAAAGNGKQPDGA